MNIFNETSWKDRDDGSTISKSTDNLEDVRGNIFYSIDFFKLLLRTDNDLLVSEIKNKNMWSPG